MQDALGLIEACAQFNAPECQISVRVAAHEGRLYLDLADAAWRAVDVGPEGWQIVDTPPVRFRRAAGILSLPEPKPGGTVNALRPFLNIHNDRDFVLAVAWLVAALRARGPYPVLVLAGEQGTAKSTLARLLRTLVDPNTLPLRALPREDRDLFIAATNGHVLAFDNVSSLRPWISDTLCRLANYHNAVKEAWAQSGLEPLQMPLQGLVQEPFAQAARAAGRWDLIGNPSGQISGSLTERRPAREILMSMVEEARETIGELQQNV